MTSVPQRPDPPSVPPAAVAEPFLPAAPPRRIRTISAALVAAGVTALLLLPGLGALGLQGDEGIYGLVVGDLLTTGRTSRLTLEGAAYLSKPPLAFWLMGISAHASELDERALRLPGVLASLALSLVVFAVARRRSGPAFAVLAVALFLSAPHALYFHGWRSAVTEPWLALWTVLALVANGRVHRPGVKHSILAALGTLSALTKGLLGPALVALTLVFADTLVHRGSGESRPKLRRFVPAVAILAPAVLAYLGWWLWNFPSLHQLARFLRRDWLLRAAGTFEAVHVQDAGYFAAQLVREFGAWLILLVPAYWPRSWRKLRADRDLEGTSYRLFPALALGVLSLPASKIAWYLYPAYPVLALVMAEGARDLWDRIARRRLLAGVMVVAIGAMLTLRVRDAFLYLPSSPRASLHGLAVFVDRVPEARVLVDERLRSAPHRPREWNRFTIRHRLRAEPWIAGAPVPESDCRFLLTPAPNGPPVTNLIEPSRVVLVAKQARSRPEPDLFIVDLCGGRFSDSVARRPAIRSDLHSAD